EGYLVHYGRPRLFAPSDEDTALLLGDYLYAHGLVRIAQFGDVDAVADLSELISLCSQLRAEHADGDGALWAASAALLGQDALDGPRSTRRRGRARATRPSTAPSRFTPAGCGRFSPMFHLLAETAAQEGKKTVLSMLVVGLVFISVIALGEVTHWLRSRNRH